MPKAIEETYFLDILKDGVSRTVHYMGQLTECRQASIMIFASFKL